MTAETPKMTVIILGPKLGIVSGVSTHVESMMSSDLAGEYNFVHFEVGSQGKRETRSEKIYRFIGSPIALALKIIRLRARIIHINTSMDAKAFWRDSIYLFVSKILRTKVVYQVHGGELPHQFFAKRKLSNAFLKRVLMTADAVVLLSEIERVSYEKFADISFLRVIPNGIDTSLYADGKTNRDKDRNGRMVYMGSLLRTKGLFEAVDAIKALRDKNSLDGFEFRIAGNGADARALSGRVYDLELQDVITFIGPVFGEEKNRFWKDADIFIFPSYTEGLPYAILESIASGTPVITTRVGGIPDVITDSVHGIFVKEKDTDSLALAIESLITDRKLLNKMSKNCMKRAKGAYSIGRMSVQFQKVYRYVAGKENTGDPANKKQ